MYFPLLLSILTIGFFNLGECQSLQCPAVRTRSGWLDLFPIPCRKQKDCSVMGPKFLCCNDVCTQGIKAVEQIRQLEASRNAEASNVVESISSSSASINTTTNPTLLATTNLDINKTPTNMNPITTTPTPISLPSTTTSTIPATSINTKPITSTSTTSTTKSTKASPTTSMTTSTTTSTTPSTTTSTNPSTTTSTTPSTTTSTMSSTTTSTTLSTTTSTTLSTTTSTTPSTTTSTKPSTITSTSSSTTTSMTPSTTTSTISSTTTSTTPTSSSTTSSTTTSTTPRTTTSTTPSITTTKITPTTTSVASSTTTSTTPSTITTTTPRVKVSTIPSISSSTILSSSSTSTSTAPSTTTAETLSTTSSTTTSTTSTTTTTTTPSTTSSTTTTTTTPKPTTTTTTEPPRPFLQIFPIQTTPQAAPAKIGKSQKLVCPKNPLPVVLFPIPCETNAQCRISSGPGQVCCQRQCVKGVPAPRPSVKEQTHQPLLGVIPRECPAAPLGELLFDVQSCKTDADCWPRVCCPDGTRSYCRTARARLDLVPGANRIDRPVRMLESYLQCTAPPENDLFPQSCNTSVDCFPNLCCAEGGKKHCRPPQRSLFSFFTSAAQYAIRQQTRRSLCENRQPLPIDTKERN